MPEIAAIFRDWRELFLNQYVHQLKWEHRRAIDDINTCRTPEMGYGILSACPSCGKRHFSWQSCGNRNCPKCGHEKVTRWLAERQREILPVDYFMITFPLPAELRTLCRREPAKVYNIFFKTASAALKDLTLDKRFLGGKIGMIGTLHTWRRDGELHPHIHFLVPGGGLSGNGQYWLYPKKRGFLVAAKPLAKLFRHKFRIELKEQRLIENAPSNVWRKNWVVDIKNVGNGMSSFKYLAPYMQRGFIGNDRIEKYDGRSVTFRYKDGETGKTKRRTMIAMEFMMLFLRHVLPSGFQKTRYYGILGSAHKKTLAEIRLLILTSRGQPASTARLEIFTVKPHLCSQCGTVLKVINYHARPPPEMEELHE